MTAEPCRKLKTNNCQLLRPKFKLTLKYEVNLRFENQIWKHGPYLAHVIEKPNLRIPNPQYFLLFKWKFDNFFIHFEFDRGDKKTKCIHKSNVIKKIVVNIGDSEFVNLVFRWREQDKYKGGTVHIWYNQRVIWIQLAPYKKYSV